MKIAFGLMAAALALSGCNPPDQHPNALILLCHKLARWQQGQRGKRLAMLRASLMRIAAIDALMWSSGRIGGSAWSITIGWFVARIDDLPDQPTL
jgi:hypothetical protein